MFHAFTPVSVFKNEVKDKKYIFFLGYPWYLKGVDVLIKAFHLVKNDIPEHKLIIAGHCDDRTYFENLRDEEERIAFLKGMEHKKVLEYMSECSIFILPSRTELSLIHI